MYDKKSLKKYNGVVEDNFFKKYASQKIFWSAILLIIVVIINVFINKYIGNYFGDFAQRISENYILTGLSFFASEILIGIFPAELFMLIYQFKPINEYFIIVLVLGVVSSASGFIAYLTGKYFNTAKVLKTIVAQKKFKELSNLFIKYKMTILILASTTPLPFALVSFIAGYFNFSAASYLKIIVPIRIIRFFISAVFIKYSLEIM